MNTEEKAKRDWGTGGIIQFKGSRFYSIRYYRNGKRITESTKSEKIKVAKNLLNQRLGEMAVNTWIAPQDRNVTVDSLYASLLDDYRNNGLASIEGAEQRWQVPAEEGEKAPEPGRLKKFFGGMKAVAVTTDMLNRYVTECREAKKSNGTINRDLAALRRAFRLGLQAGKIQKVPGFPHLKESAPRKGFVEESDYAKLAANTRALWMRALLGTAYTLGFRKSELLGLRVSQVDLGARTITLNAGETKSGDGRTVSMTQDVHTLLTACVSGKKPGDYVFTHRDGSQILDFRGAWETLTAAAGRPGLLFHDLRRSAVRNMVRRGIPEVIAMRISGHKTRAVFDRYNIVSESDLAEAARKIEAGARVWAENGQSFTNHVPEQNQQSEQKHLN